MRTSRIAHPPANRFVQIHCWAVRAVGKAAATVLGVLDFLDRGQEQAGCILATRARLIADLEGFVSRDCVDKALAVLIDIGWVHRYERSVMGPRNLQTSYEYSLDADAISAYLEDSRLPENRTPGIRKNESPEHDNQACRQDAKPDPSIDVLDLDPLVAADSVAADNWLNSSTHPMTAAALVKIATTTWRAKPDSNLEFDRKHCRQALHAAAPLSDVAAAAVVDGVSDRGGWPKDALADLRSAADKHRRDAAYQAQQAENTAKAKPIASAAKDERYAWLIGRYVDSPAGRIKITKGGIYQAHEGKYVVLPQLLEEINAGRLRLCDTD